MSKNQFFFFHFVCGFSIYSARAVELNRTPIVATLLGFLMELMHRDICDMYLFCNYFYSGLKFNIYTSKYSPIFLYDSIKIAPNYLTMTAKIAFCYVLTCFLTSQGHL